MSKEEGALDLSRPAQELHNRVRAFAGWPGATVKLWLSGADGQPRTAMVLKVLQSRLGPSSDGSDILHQPDLTVQALRLPCGPDGSEVLEVIRLQPENKKPMGPRDWLNGMKGRTVHLNPE